MPPVPDHFKRLSDVNRKGPALLKNLNDLIPLNIESLKEEMKKKGRHLIDIRGYDFFSAQHIIGSLNIKLEGSFSNYAGYMQYKENK